jgi:domain of unknown function DUF1828
MKWQTKLEKVGYKPEKINDFYVIKTPFTFSNGDLIDIYIKEKNNKLYIIDENAIIENQIKKRLSEKEIINIVSKYGIELKNDILLLETNVKNIIKDLEKMIKATIEMERKIRNV